MARQPVAEADRESAQLSVFRQAHTGYKDFGRVLTGIDLVLLALHPFSRNCWRRSLPMTRQILTRLSAHIVFIVQIGALLIWTAHSSVAVVLLAMLLATNGMLTITADIALALDANLGSAVNPVWDGARKDAYRGAVWNGNSWWLLNRAEACAKGSW